MKCEDILYQRPEAILNLARVKSSWHVPCTDTDYVSTPEFTGHRHARHDSIGGESPLSSDSSYDGAEQNSDQSPPVIRFPQPISTSTPVTGYSQRFILQQGTKSGLLLSSPDSGRSASPILPHLSLPIPEQKTFRKNTESPKPTQTDDRLTSHTEGARTHADLPPTGTVIGEDKKCSRWCYSVRQVHTLDRVFLDNPYPDTETMEQLSSDLGIPEKNIKIWFQNKRARTRRRVQLYGANPAVASMPPMFMPTLQHHPSTIAPLSVQSHLLRPQGYPSITYQPARVSLKPNDNALLDMRNLNLAYPSIPFPGVGFPPIPFPAPQQNQFSTPLPMELMRNFSNGFVYPMMTAYK